MKKYNQFINETKFLNNKINSILPYEFDFKIVMNNNLEKPTKKQLEAFIKEVNKYFLGWNKQYDKITFEKFFEYPYLYNLHRDVFVLIKNKKALYTSSI